MGGWKLSFFFTDILLLVVFIGLSRTVFKLSGFGFIVELLGLFVLLMIAFLSLIPAYEDANSGWGFLALVFFLVLIDLFLIWLRTNLFTKTQLLTAFAASMGLFIAIVKLKPKRLERAEGDENVVSPAVKTEFYPGKYVASSTGTVFHKATCDWAKKIQKKKQVWFGTEQEAKKSYKPHSCLQ
mgnify:CR=1 FL=1